MEFMNQFLPIVIYLLLIVLLVVAIIIGIKVITTMNRVEDILDDVNTKIRSLDKIFEIIDFTSNRVSMISDVVLNFCTSTVKKVFGAVNSKKKESEIDE